MIWWGLFVFFSLALSLVSRRALQRPGSHGFYRFFAWECIMGLALLNAGVWFRDPWAWYQLLSWILLLTSIPLVLIGVRLLKKMGQQNAQRGDADTFIIEKTTHLVTAGLYGRIRHPLYSSLLCLAWGIFLKRPHWPGLLLALAATGFLYAAARVEESENLNTFGPEYAAYMQHTKMFIPYIF